MDLARPSRRDDPLPASPLMGWARRRRIDLGPRPPISREDELLEAVGRVEFLARMIRAAGASPAGPPLNRELGIAVRNLVILEHGQRCARRDRFGQIYGAGSPR